MRLLWTFFAGAMLSVLALIVALPVLGGAAAFLHWLSNRDGWVTLSGPSYFSVRDRQGQLEGRMADVHFQPVILPRLKDHRPPPILVRFDVSNSVFADSGAEGAVHLQAWPLKGPATLERTPLYNVTVPGRSARIQHGDLLMVSHGGGRKSAYSLSNGRWLFDADAPIAVFTEPDTSAAEGGRRLIAVAQSPDGVIGNGVAVLAYATPERILSRVLLYAHDPVRARFLRGTVSMTRAVERIDSAGKRVLELQLPAGLVRIGIQPDSLDLAAASVPDGLALAPMVPWGGKVPAPAPAAPAVSVSSPAPAVLPPASAARPALPAGKP